MRRRRLGVAPLLLVACALLVAACSSDDEPEASSRTTTTTTTVVPGDPVPLDEVELGADSASSALRVADTTYVIDGLHRIDGDRAQLRIWLLDGATPDEAVPIDLPVVGGLWFVDAVWFDDHLAVTGTQCDDWYEWYDVRDPSADEDPPCLAGSVERLLIIDPLTWRVDEVEGLSRSWEERGLDLLAAPDGSLLVHDGTPEPSLLRMVDLESTPTRIADAPSEAACFVGDDLVVVQRVGGEDNSELLLPLHELYQAEELRDGIWVPLELPVTDHAGTSGQVRGCTDAGLLVNRMVVGGFDQPIEPYSFELRQVDGALTWVPLPPADAEGHELFTPWAGPGVISDSWFDDGSGTVILRGDVWVQAPEIGDPADVLLEIDQAVGSILYLDQRPGENGAYDPAGIDVFVPPS